MAWIEAHQELRDHPKTKRAARTLGISRPQMIGHLFCLWWWSLDYAEDGDLSDFDAEDIADAAEWDGDADAFVSALVDCGPADRPGFLVEDNGGLSIRDWSQYGGKYVTKRKQGRDRQRAYRERNAQAETSNADVTRYASVSNTPREENIREEKRTSDNGKSSDDELVDHEVVEAVSKWQTVFAGTPFAVKPPVEKFYRWLAFGGPDVLYHMIEQAKDKDNPTGWLYTTYDNWRKDGEVAPYIAQQVEKASRPKSRPVTHIINPITGLPEAIAA